MRDARHPPAKPEGCANLNGQRVPPYDLTSLRILVSVADELSITGAARREHIAVSAVSKRVSELEALAGSALLERRARGVTLTSSGEVLVASAREILQVLRTAQSELDRHAGGLRGRVRVHANTWAITEFLPDELHAFAALHPDIDVDVEEQVASSTLRAVADGSADLGIITGTASARALHIYPYHSDRLVIVLPAAHPLARRGSARFVDTLDFEYVGYQDESPLQQLLTQAAAEAGRSLRIRIHVRSFEAMCRMVREDLGIAVLPAKTVRCEARAVGVRSVTLDEPWAHRQMHVCIRDPDSLPIAARRLLDHLIESARD